MHPVRKHIIHNPNRCQINWRIIIHITRILLCLSFPSSPPTTMSLYAGVFGQLNLWFIFKIRDTDTVPLHHGRKGTLKTFMWLQVSPVSAHKLRGHAVKEQAEKGITPSKALKNYTSFTKLERWERMLFQLGICPIEIFNTEVQKLKYSKPAPIQKSEFPRWDYHSRNSMFIGS